MADAATPTAMAPVPATTVPMESKLTKSDDAAVADLIRQLGATRFSDRERASKTLLSHGLNVYTTLQSVQDHPDRETRLRVRELLSDLVQLDRDRRIAGFLSGEHREDSQYENLPGWELMRQIAGDSSASRRLMAEMLQGNWDLLSSADRDPSDAATLLMQRCKDLQDAVSLRREQVQTADVAALLLLAVHPETGIYQNTQQQIYNFCYRIRVQPAPSDPSAEVDPLRKLLGAWVSRPADVGNTAFYSLNIALRYALPEGLVPAVQILDENAAAPYIRQYAILSVARFKDHQSRHRLESLLHDDSVCYTQKDPRSKHVAFESQIRDVALAILIHLDGRDPAEFGFTRMRTSNSMVFQPNTLGFTTQEKRQEAIDAYLKHRAELGSPLPLNLSADTPNAVPPPRPAAATAQ